MAGLFDSLRPVAEALVGVGMPALRGEAELADLLPAVANAAARAPQTNTLLYDSAAASPSDVTAAARAVAESVAAGQPDGVRDALAGWLALVPAAVVRSAGEAATHAPARAADPADLTQCLPPRVPRFRTGDRPAGLGGDWALDSLLGVGGFGEVWKARHVRFTSIPPVAVKFCLNPHARDRLLLHEASVLDRVLAVGHHPGIVPLRDARLAADPPCLVYEYVDGGDLAGLAATWPAPPDPLRRDRADAAVRDLALTVGHMHRLAPPIVHRDLKPSNVLVSRPAGSGVLPPGGYVLRITDFGIGAAGDPGSGDLGRAGLLGSHTPPFASPQQRRGEPADPRDDVHALGVIWYQLLTADRRVGTAGRLPSDWTRRLADASVPVATARLLADCVAPDAADRPADAAELAARLASLAAPAAGPVTGSGIAVPGYHLLAELPDSVEDWTTVYRARRATGGPDVRLKVFAAGLVQPAWVQRAVRVAQPALDRAGVTGLVRALDCGMLPDGSTWMATEYVPAASLRLRLSTGTLGLGQAARLARDLARILQAVHAAGRPRPGSPAFIHGNVEPSQVFLDGPAVRLAEAGLVNQPGDAAFVGGSRYAAPEAIDAGRVGPKTDVYGLGALLYHLLAGRPPFDSLADRAGRRQLAPPFDPGRSLPRPLADLCLRCLYPDPARRPTVDEVARLLRPFADNPPSPS